MNITQLSHAIFDKENYFLANMRRFSYDNLENKLKPSKNLQIDKLKVQ